MFRGTFGMVIAVITAIIGVGFAVLKYQVLDAVLPTEMLSAVNSVRAAVEGSSEPVKDDGKRKVVATAEDGPGKFLVDGPDGLRAEGPIAAISGNLPIFIDDLISGYAATSDDAVPSMVTTIRPISGCRPTPPAEGTVVGHVTAGKSGLPLPLTTYDDGDLAAGVQGFVDAYRAGDADPAAGLRGPVYEAYDVAVTETRAPVYLVLENQSGNRIWNIHATDGARIERVVLLGGHQAGVANLDPVVPVEVILGEGLADCAVSPAYRLNPNHEILAKIASGETAVQAGQESLARIESAAAAYDTWFRDTFGVLASATRAGFDAGTISAVGPVPRQSETKADYLPIRGSTLRTTQSTYFEIDGQVPAGEDFASRVKAIATTFAFGDLSYLRQGADF
ncbi:MAG: hypothetical protein ACKO2N_13980 [Tabrizicola sp.]